MTLVYKLVATQIDLERKKSQDKTYIGGNQTHNSRVTALPVELPCKPWGAKWWGVRHLYSSDFGAYTH